MREQNTTSDRLFMSVSVSNFDGDVESLIDRIDDHLSLQLERSLETGLPCRDVAIEVYPAPLLAGISDQCPQCQTTLELSNPVLNHDNGATVDAYCRDCGWDGHGVYRLTDFTEYPDDEPINSPARFRPISLVATGRISPTYYYPDPSGHDR